MRIWKQKGDNIDKEINQMLRDQTKRSGGLKKNHAAVGKV